VEEKSSHSINKPPKRKREFRIASKKNDKKKSKERETKLNKINRKSVNDE
jgi:hypothetical protein